MLGREAIELRLAHQDDLTQLLALLPQLSSDPRSKGAVVPAWEQAARTFDQLLRQGNVFVAVAVQSDPNLVVGSCTIVVVPNLRHGGRPWAVVENVVVATTHRDQGIGTQLMEYAFELARRQGCYKVQLVSGPKAEQIRFYQRLGMDDQDCHGFKKYL